ncbi:hypothetical protein H4R34_004684 [Dimargaris verticillata]|uniref:Little elongation complex subunit 2 C-terminal domain-containing protein n=1 Tax=Dimargaris verticillata TaxID=2761393 RepID=A0A9W8B533_9FUNG|nr:hypothetical protein H4R34_004684 [Dimargaris verticillata]
MARRGRSLRSQSTATSKQATPSRRAVPAANTSPAISTRSRASPKRGRRSSTLRVSSDSDSPPFSHAPSMVSDKPESPALEAVVIDANASDSAKTKDPLPAPLLSRSRSNGLHSTDIRRGHTPEPVSSATIPEFLAEVAIGVSSSPSSAASDSPIDKPSSATIRPQTTVAKNMPVAAASTDKLPGLALASALTSDDTTAPLVMVLAEKRKPGLPPKNTAATAPLETPPKRKPGRPPKSAATGTPDAKAPTTTPAKRKPGRPRKSIAPVADSTPEADPKPSNLSEEPSSLAPAPKRRCRAPKPSTVSLPTEVPDPAAAMTPASAPLSEPLAQDALVLDQLPPPLSPTVPALQLPAQSPGVLPSASPDVDQRSLSAQPILHKPRRRLTRHTSKKAVSPAAAKAQRKPIVSDGSDTGEDISDLGVTDLLSQTHQSRRMPRSTGSLNRNSAKETKLTQELTKLTEAMLTSSDNASGQSGTDGAGGYGSDSDVGSFVVDDDVDDPKLMASITQGLMSPSSPQPLLAKPRSRPLISPMTRSVPRSPRWPPTTATATARKPKLSSLARRPQSVAAAVWTRHVKDGTTVIKEQDTQPPGDFGRLYAAFLTETAPFASADPFSILKTESLQLYTGHSQRLPYIHPNPSQVPSTIRQHSSPALLGDSGAHGGAPMNRSQPGGGFLTTLLGKITPSLGTTTSPAGQPQARAATSNPGVAARQYMLDSVEFNDSYQGSLGLTASATAAPAHHFNFRHQQHQLQQRPPATTRQRLLPTSELTNEDHRNYYKLTTLHKTSNYVMSAMERDQLDRLMKVVQREQKAFADFLKAEAAISLRFLNAHVKDVVEHYLEQQRQWILYAYPRHYRRSFTFAPSDREQTKQTSIKLNNAVVLLHSGRCPRIRVPGKDQMPGGKVAIRNCWAEWPSLAEHSATQTESRPPTRAVLDGRAQMTPLMVVSPEGHSSNPGDTTALSAAPEPAQATRASAQPRSSQANTECSNEKVDDDDDDDDFHLGTQAASAPGIHQANAPDPTRLPHLPQLSEDPLVHQFASHRQPNICISDQCLAYLFQMAVKHQGYKNYECLEIPFTVAVHPDLETQNPASTLKADSRRVIFVDDPWPAPNISRRARNQMYYDAAMQTQFVDDHDSSYVHSGEESSRMAPPARSKQALLSPVTISRLEDVPWTQMARTTTPNAIASTVPESPSRLFQHVYSESAMTSILDWTNLQYALWQFGSQCLLVRTRFHGFVQDEKALKNMLSAPATPNTTAAPTQTLASQASDGNALRSPSVGHTKYVAIKAKLEYQFDYGPEKVADWERIDWWSSLYLCGDAELLLARIDPARSELTGLHRRRLRDLMANPEWLNVHSRFVHDLLLQLGNISQPGHYVLQKTPGQWTFQVLQAIIPRQPSPAASANTTAESGNRPASGEIDIGERFQSAPAYGEDPYDYISIENQNPKNRIPFTVPHLLYKKANYRQHYTYAY